MSGQKPRVWVIDGIIGAGKTTFINLCLVPYLRARGLRITVVSEPVDEWEASGALVQFYGDPSRRGFQFQINAFVSRVDRAIQQFEAHHDETDIYILERSIFTDLLFMKVLSEDKVIDETEYSLYLRLWSRWTGLMPFAPTMFIYLRPDLDSAMDRCIKRKRDGEGCVSLDYQHKLMAAHDQFLDGKSTVIKLGHGEEREVPIHKIASNANFRDDGAVANWLLSEVLNFAQQIKA